MTGSWRNVTIGGGAALGCAALAVFLFVRWWPPVIEGIEALAWPAVPGEIVYAEYYSNYDAEASSYIYTTERRNNFTFLAVAYWVHTVDG